MANTPGKQRNPRVLLVLAAIVLAADIVSLFAGANIIEQAHSFVRISARLTAILFCVAFSASSLQWLLRTAWTRQLLLNRRYVGLAAAFSHFLHLLSLIMLNQVDPEFVVPMVTRVLGGLGFVMFGILAATSSDAAVRALGGRNWKRLHTAGMYYIWIIFLNSYAGRVAAGSLGYVPLLVLVLGAYGLRLYTWWRQRAATSQTVAVGA